jgi:hypothetical protein
MTQRTRNLVAKGLECGRQSEVIGKDILLRDSRESERRGAKVELRLESEQP